MSQVPLGTFTVQQVGKKRALVIGVILSLLMTLQAQRWLVQDHATKSNHRLRILTQSV